MFNFNYLLSSFQSPSSFTAANFNREVPLSHASFVNCGHDDQGDMDAKKKKKKTKKKKGRQTKIWTARGVRDRRVRLSMEASRKFFGLQDALGFDTASDTIEWLISESGNAIEEVKLANEVPGGGPHVSPTDAAMARDPSGCNRTEKEARRKCRAIARARARERTQAKKNHHNDGCNSQYRSDFLP